MEVTYSNVKQQMQRLCAHMVINLPMPSLQIKELSKQITHQYFKSANIYLIKIHEYLVVRSQELEYSLKFARSLLSQARFDHSALTSQFFKL